MKKAIFLSLILAFVACNKQETQVKDAAAAVARVTFLKGEAHALRGTEKLPLQVGVTLQQGDKVTTGADAQVEVFLKGQGIVRLSENSELALSVLGEGNNTQLGLNSGTGAFFLKKMDRAGDFKVQAPTAVAGVRGTTFLMSVPEAGTTRIALYDGAIAVNNDKGKELVIDKPGEINVRSGQDLTAQSVKPLSGESLGALKKLAVFQRGEVMEYNSILDEVKSSEVLKGIVVEQSVSDKFAELRDESGRPDQAQKMRRADENTIRRDTKQDPLKIEPNRTF
jgi:ferric-dicitrate binding protein FerR (iron transport regulator)